MMEDKVTFSDEDLPYETVVNKKTKILTDRVNINDLKYYETKMIRKGVVSNECVSMGLGPNIFYHKSLTTLAHLKYCGNRLPWIVLVPMIFWICDIIFIFKECVQYNADDGYVLIHFTLFGIVLGIYLNVIFQYFFKKYFKLKL